MNTLPLCLRLAVISCVVAYSSLLACGADKPNIVFIYADDLGYGDVAIYNPDSQIPTPHIDRLAKEGLRFTDAHSPHATCTGSRYGLLTGTSSARSGVNNRILKYGPAIDPDEITIADFLKRQGYTTKMVGKWHLGFNYAPHEPHNPAVPEEQFVGLSKAGPYGDYVVQLDHWVGRILQALEESNLADNTLVIFASDNGAQTKFTVDYPAHSPNGVLSGGKSKGKRR